MATREPAGKQRKPRVFYGWWVVLLGGLVQGYTSGVFFQGFGAFFTPIAEQLGWSRGATALATSIQRAGQSVLSPFAGMAFDRFGPRWLIALGLFTIGVSFILMSRSQELWHFYGSVLLLTVGISFGTFIVLVGTVSNWFIRKRSRAISVLMACTAVGGMAVPLLVLVIDTYGWRETMVGVGVGFWIIAVPAVVLIRRRPEEYGLVPDGDESLAQARARGAQEGGRQRSHREFEIPVRAALRTRFFWQLALGTSLGHMMTGTTILHIDAMQSFGISRGVAGLAVFGVAASSFAGRLGFGFLGDMMDKRVLMALAFTLQIIGGLSLIAANFELMGFNIGKWSLPVFAIAFGLGFGGSIPVRLSMIADYFGRRSYGSMLGLVSTVNQGLAAISPVAVGAAFDITGTYRLPMLVLAAILSLSIPMMLLLEEPSRVTAIFRLSRQRRRAAEAAAPPGGDGD